VNGRLEYCTHDDDSEEFLLYTDFDIFYVDSILRGFTNKQIKLSIEVV
jgi:hypothetical protein